MRRIGIKRKTWREKEQKQNHLMPHQITDFDGQICVAQGVCEDERYVEEVVIPSIIQGIQKGDVRFPYKQDWIPLRVIEENMKRFDEIKLETDNKPYRICNFVCKSGLIDSSYRFGPLCPPYKSESSSSSHLTIRTTPAWYPIYHIIADWFVEHVRLQARPSYSPLSPIKHWVTPQASRSIVRKCWEKYRCFTPFSLRESMYRILKECETFKTALAYLLYTTVFQAKSVLDFCAGWGDRLTAAIAAGIVYTGVDPNPKMLPCYKDIIKTLGGNDQKKYQIVSDGFIEAQLPSEPKEYDLVFTCPPYYTLELYDEYDSKSKQSVVQFPTVEKWIKGFLCAAVKKAWQSLKMGGYMCIVINDFNDIHKKNLDIATYCEPMILYAQAYLPNCQYCGVIAYATSGTINFDPHQPMWIFHKSEKINPHITSNQAKIALEKHYSFLVE